MDPRFRCGRQAFRDAGDREPESAGRTDLLRRACFGGSRYATTFAAVRRAGDVNRYQGVRPLASTLTLFRRGLSRRHGWGWYGDVRRSAGTPSVGRWQPAAPKVQYLPVCRTAPRLLRPDLVTHPTSYESHLYGLQRSRYRACYGVILQQQDRPPGATPGARNGIAFWAKWARCSTNSCIAPVHYATFSLSRVWIAGVAPDAAPPGFSRPAPPSPQSRFLVLLASIVSIPFRPIPHISA